MGVALIVMNALKVAKLAPTAVRSFQTSAPRQGVVSTLGYLGIAGVMAGPAIPGGESLINTYMAKDEYKTLAWIGGMTVFGTMASMTGAKKEEAAGDDFDFDAFMASLEEEKK